MEKILLDVNEVLTLNDINVAEYTMYLIEPFSNEDEKNNAKKLKIYDIPRELLKSENLTEELESLYTKQQENIGE